MASLTGRRSVHATLSTTTADLITWARSSPFSSVAVTNRHASEMLYVRPYATSEVQTITLSSWDATDTVKLTHNSVASAAVTYASDVSAEIQAALESLPSIGSGNVKVTRTDVNTYVCYFQNQLSGVNVGAITVTNGTGSATGSVAETIAGGSTTAVAAADGTFLVLPASVRTFRWYPAPAALSVVGSGNAYAVEGI